MTAFFLPSSGACAPWYRVCAGGGDPLDHAAVRVGPDRVRARGGDLVGCMPWGALQSDFAPSACIVCPPCSAGGWRVPGLRLWGVL
jgi:hypothetical protein